MIPVDEYVMFLDSEYLGDYVSGGGTAVKFVVPPDDAAAVAFVDRFGTAATEARYLAARVDSVDTRVHLLEQVFFDIARQVDWDDLAAVAAARAVEAAGYPASAAGGLSLDQLASHYRVDPRELKRDVDRQLQRLVAHDYAMVQDFRTAMLRLCQAQLHSGQVVDAEHAAVLDWLRGDLRQISALKSALIFRRIGRHNAREMLFSLAYWLAINDRAGLALVIDIRRLGFTRRPSPEERHGHYYTKAALLDAYEVLRELVDNTDEMANCIVVVVASPAFLSDAPRGLDAYQALKLRIFDEVRDVNRDNPFSSLIRLGGGMSGGLAVERRRALEALRAGVPNRDAVTVLGSMQQGVEDRFSQLVAAVRAVPDGPAPGGMLIGGGFGTGKSHVLEHLAHVALSEGFVVSKVVISKETPLHDPAKVYRAAIDAAKVPGRPGSAIDEVSGGLQIDSPRYADLYRWAHQEAAPVDSRFPATLFLHEYARGDEEFVDRIVRFWAGDPLPVADLRRRLKEAGAAATYGLAPIKERDLSLPTVPVRFSPDSGGGPRWLGGAT